MDLAPDDAPGLTAREAAYGLCHLYLNTFGPLTVAEIEGILKEDGDAEALLKDGLHIKAFRRAPQRRITRTLRRMVREGVVLATLQHGEQTRYRLQHQR